MRVRVSPGERRDERGVTAVIVALLAVVMLGIGAFSIDLGLSYASTRQLQTASDAAALAAANVFKKSPGTSCSAVLAAGSTGARAAADAIRLENRPASTRLAYDASCGTDGSITVTYRSQGTTPRFFGQFWGRTTDYTSDRTATAKVKTLTGGTGIRPYAICASQIPATAAATGAVFKISLPASGNAVCPGAGSSGNWWTVDCPESAGNNSNSVLADKTLNGCTSTMDVVPDQQNPARTAVQLRQYLESYCSSRTNDTSSCLGANPGGISGNQVMTAWDTLAREQRRIVLPVFCGGPTAGACDTAAVVNAGGNNAVYPIQSLAGLQVCGYRFGKNDSYPASGSTALTGECGGANNPLNLTTSETGAQVNYLLLRSVDVPVLGSVGGGCALGTACDQGRVAFLTG